MRRLCRDYASRYDGLPADHSFGLAHQYTDNGSFTVTVTVTDPQGAVGTDTRLVTVDNVAPVVFLTGGDTTLDEGSTFSASGAFIDPGADTWTATVDYGDGTGLQPLTLTAAKTFALSHFYADAGAYTVTVTVSDDDLASGSTSTQVQVNNVDPSTAVIDVIPDSDENSINLNSISKKKPSNATVPVVLFTTAQFNAAAVDVGTVRWAGAGVHDSLLEDVDNDGDLDLLMYFRLKDTNLLAVFSDLADPDGNRNKQTYTVTTTLTGATTTGADFTSTDDVALTLTGKALRDLLDSL